MRIYQVKREDHHVYEDLSELPEDLVYLKDWRKAEIGDWVLADDGCIIQVLRRGILAFRKKKFAWVGTCTGTWKCTDYYKMDTDRRENIYSFSTKLKGDKSEYMHPLRKGRLTSNEILFAQHLTRGLSPEDAYIKAFRTENKEYAKTKASFLIKTERIRKAMKEELKPVLKSLGISPELVLEGIKDIATDEEAKHSDKLKALFELGEILELKESHKVTEVTGALFQGFDPQQIEATKRPILKEA